jgi:hypothetical protein
MKLNTTRSDILGLRHSTLGMLWEGKPTLGCLTPDRQC